LGPWIDLQEKGPDVKLQNDRGKSVREKKEEQKVRVVDRRPFGKDGERREVEERRRPAEDVSRQDGASVTGASVSTERAPGGAASFSDFLRSLGASCLMSLGAIPGHEKKLNVDLGAAESIIEVIDMLKEKTSGNLTAEESKELTGTIAELKLLFARVARETAPSGRLTK